MATNLYAISNINLSKNEILENRESYLDQLEKLQLTPISVFQPDEGMKPLEGNWSCEFPTEMFDKFVLRYDGVFEFDIEVYEHCLLLISVYEYRLIYELKDAFNQNFRTTVYNIISIFGGTEVLYLADNGCDKLTCVLENQVQQGIGYYDVKEKLLEKGLQLKTNYFDLNIKDLNCSDTNEFMVDSFEMFKKEQAMDISPFQKN